MYAAARYSVVDLDSGVFDKLAGSPTAVNSYARTSVGLGYALTENTQLKVEYSFNDTDGPGAQPKLDQWAIGAASKF
jgi:hypothetical protein